MTYDARVRAFVDRLIEAGVLPKQPYELRMLKAENLTEQERAELAGANQKERTTMAKQRNPQDSTLRNVRAFHRALKALARTGTLTKKETDLRIKALEVELAVVQAAIKDLNSRTATSKELQRAVDRTTKAIDGLKKLKITVVPTIARRVAARRKTITGSAGRAK